MTGIELITQEREEQITKHQRDIESDKLDNKDYQLMNAARILLDQFLDDNARSFIWFTPNGWNVDVWKHMCAKPYKERLIIAGALIAAEIDRIS